MSKVGTLLAQKHQLPTGQCALLLFVLHTSSQRSVYTNPQVIKLADDMGLLSSLEAQHRGHVAS